MGVKGVKRASQQDMNPAERPVSSKTYKYCGEIKKKKPETALSPQAKDPLWQMLDEKLGGRDGLLAASLASSNPKAADLAALILDKSHRTWGTKALARKAGLSAIEIHDMFRDKKWLEASLALHEGLPDVVRDATEDAKASLVPCEACRATGWIQEGEKTGLKCYLCKDGFLRKPGDKDKLRFVGEAANMVGKQAPMVQTNVQINAQSQNISTSFEDLMKRASVKVVKPKQIEGIDEE